MSNVLVNTQFGFKWGSAKIQRLFDDDKKEWVTLGLETPKYKENHGLQIYVTKSGKVRIFDATGEWSKPKSRSKK